MKKILNVFALIKTNNIVHMSFYHILMLFHNLMYLIHNHYNLKYLFQFLLVFSVFYDYFFDYFLPLFYFLELNVLMNFVFLMKY